jgi:hypothetical protein
MQGSASGWSRPPTRDGDDWFAHGHVQRCGTPSYAAHFRPRIVIAGHQQFADFRLEPLHTGRRTADPSNASACQHDVGLQADQLLRQRSCPIDVTAPPARSIRTLRPSVQLAERLTLAAFTIAS